MAEGVPPLLALVLLVVHGQVVLAVPGQEHGIALGTALTDEEVQALDRPMLWYVEQAVADPRCTVASTVCGSVNALVPQV